jgi:multiple sugar transport system substrate-binding protein
VISTYYEIASTGKSVGASPAGQQIKQELTNAFTAYLLGKKSVQQALGDAQTASMNAYRNVTGG